MANEPHASGNDGEVPEFCQSIKARAHDPLAAARAAPRCGAKSRRTGEPCKSAAMANGRCRMHGGASTGPRTAEGLERSRKANWQHGYHSHEKIAERRAARAEVRQLREWLTYAKIMDRLGFEVEL
jgi:hypothetical protein